MRNKKATFFIVAVFLVVLLQGCVPTTPTSPPTSPPPSRPPRTLHVPTPVEDAVANQLIKDIRAHGKDVRELPHQQNLAPPKSVAVIWSPEKTPFLKDLLPRYASNITINTVLLALSEKQLKKSAQVTSNSLKNDPLFGWIDSAQKMGFRVFLITPFRLATGYSEIAVTGSSGAEVDIFSPEAKKGLLSFYRDIARYPLNGVYVTDISYGMKEGFTPHGIATYQDAFSEKLASRPNLNSPLNSPWLWRFAGLKSRHLTKLLNAIWAEIQLGAPEMEFGINVPEILLIDPTKGLMETSLDYLELKEAQFDFYAVDSMGSGAQRVSELLLKYGKLEKVWFHRTRKETIVSLLEMPIQGVIVTATP